MKKAERERLEARLEELLHEEVEFHKRKAAGETATLLGYEKNLEAEIARLRDVLSDE